MQNKQVEEQSSTPEYPGSFDEYREELIAYLTSRFGSLAFAERICAEVKARLADSDILSLVGNPRVYLSGYGLSLGAQFLVEEQYSGVAGKGVLL